MSKPWLFDHRQEPGVRGALARWWYERRVSQIKAALRDRHEDVASDAPEASPHCATPEANDPARRAGARDRRAR